MSTPIARAGVTRVLAVTSCKGGVGKSTVALQLALALRTNGMRVGLLDADIHGPSLPSFLPPTVAPAQFYGDRLAPVQALGLACMSWGFVPRELTHVANSHTQATVLRGRDTASVAVQLALGTQWDLNGKLDVLVVDMPPGTGDTLHCLDISHDEETKWTEENHHTDVHMKTIIVTSMSHSLHSGAAHVPLKTVSHVLTALKASPSHHAVQAMCPSACYLRCRSPRQS